MHIGLVGIGAMGLSMAGHIKQKGYTTTVFDTADTAIEAAKANDLELAGSLTELAEIADTILVMVSTDEQVRMVVDELLVAGMKEEATIVVTATNSPDNMIELCKRCRTQGIELVDAPVCYGLQGVKQGNLVSLCGGSDGAIKKIEPVLMCYSRSVEHIGDTGSGQIAKTCNNMMHWAACVANYETLALAKSYGLDAQAMRETLLKCPAHNTTLARWDTSRFTWHEKDMDVALELSQQVNLSLPLFGLVDQLIKTLGPDDVRALLHEENASYLGRPIGGHKQTSDN